MSDLLVFELEFTEKGQLQSAFGLLIDHDGVESCSVELDAMSARFMAAGGVGSALVERIYEVGGLRWCSRHSVTGQAG